MSQDWITESLTLCAEQDIDLTDAVYDGFFAACPAAIPLMEHSDQHMRGRMLSEVLEMLLTELTSETAGYLSWEIDNHVAAYAVTLDMYLPFFQALQAAVQTALAEAWQPEHQQAWDARLAATLDVIKNHPPTSRVG